MENKGPVCPCRPCLGLLRSRRLIRGPPQAPASRPLLGALPTPLGAAPSPLCRLPWLADALSDRSSRAWRLSPRVLK